MLSPGPAKKVTIHLNEDTSSARDFLYTEVFNFLYGRGVAGATMIRPDEGFGSHHRIHAAGGEHMPVRIEFLESAEVIDSIMGALCELVTDGVIEVQSTAIVKIASRVQPV